MAEVITHYVAPIAIIPPQSLMAGEIVALRRQLSRTRKAETIKQLQIKLEAAEARLEKFNDGRK